MPHLLGINNADNKQYAILLAHNNKLEEDLTIPNDVFRTANQDQQAIQTIDEPDKKTEDPATLQEGEPFIKEGNYDADLIKKKPITSDENVLAKITPTVKKNSTPRPYQCKIGNFLDNNCSIEFLNLNRASRWSSINDFRDISEQNKKRTVNYFELKKPNTFIKIKVNQSFLNSLKWLLSERIQIVTKDEHQKIIGAFKLMFAWKSTNQIRGKFNYYLVKAEQNYEFKNLKIQTTEDEGVVEKKFTCSFYPKAKDGDTKCEIFDFDKNQEISEKPEENLKKLKYSKNEEEQTTKVQGNGFYLIKYEEAKRQLMSKFEANKKIYLHLNGGINQPNENDGLIFTTIAPVAIWDDTTKSHAFILDINSPIIYELNPINK